MTFRPQLGAGFPFLRGAESISFATARAVVAGLVAAGSLPPAVEARLRLGEELSPCREADGTLVFFLGALELLRISPVGDDSVSVKISLEAPAPVDLVVVKLDEIPPFDVSVELSRPEAVELSVDVVLSEEGES